ncbi:MAG: glutamate-5-semialdehyde dehydrogenase [Oscillospiraceae bacterium]|nr:glutamate-5-semialdehyde dehydrogenase [Oscillospiraceae bacterium]
MSYIEELGIRAKNAENNIRNITTDQKNRALTAIAEALKNSVNKSLIITENKKDLENAKKNGMTKAFIDRLTLTEERIEKISESVMEIVALADPIDEILGGGQVRDGFNIVKKRVPLGVIGVIYESRPNVTVDAAALCLKSGNVCMLRGGSDAIYSNMCLALFMRRALEDCGVTADCIILVEDTSREVAADMMKLNNYIDVLIPRGGSGLIRSVVKNSTVPVLQTGEGNCHLYVDANADIGMAVRIADNAKTQRPSVCNAIETLLVHKNAAEETLRGLYELWKGVVTIYGDKKTSAIIPVERIATEEDYYTEFNDYIIAIKVVKNVGEAIAHVNKYGTNHSECIITQNYENARRFQQEVDAAAVYVNASTRFTDGNVFGLGAEIGISNQKLHARGPLGLRELTSYKYLIYGNGQIRT